MPTTKTDSPSWCPGGPQRRPSRRPAVDASAPAPAADAAPAPPPAPRSLALTLTPGEQLAVTLSVANAEGRTLGSARAAVGQVHGLPNLAVTPGSPCLVTVRRVGRALPAGPASSYRLLVRLGALGAGDEREPNEAAGEATPLPPAHTGPEAAGFFAGTKDQDWFAIPIGAAAEATVISVELDPPPGITALLTVYDGSAAKVTSVRGRKGERVVLRQLGPAALARGALATAPAFFVAVSSEGGVDLERRYLLRVRAEDAPSSEREPNDDNPRATPLSAEAPLTGFVTAGDVDLYRVAVPGGQPLTLALAPPAKSDLILEALVPGQPRWAKADAGRRGHTETLALGPTPPGDVFVRVTAKRGGETGDEPYRITVGAVSAAVPVP